MTEPRLQPFGAVRLPLFIRLGAPCPECLRVFRNEQALGSHRHYKHGRRRDA